jgi:uncharacterized membrane protein
MLYAWAMFSIRDTMMIRATQNVFNQRAASHPQKSESWQHNSILKQVFISVWFFIFVVVLSIYYTNTLDAKTQTDTDRCNQAVLEEGIILAVNLAIEAKR